MSDKCCNTATCDRARVDGNCRFCKASCAECVHKPPIEESDILKFIDGMRAVTPQELSNRYGAGDHTISIDNVYVAFGLSGELVSILLGLCKQKKLYISPCAMGIMDWIVSGCSIPTKMKMATGRDWAKYKTERWYPCEFMTRKWFEYRINHIKMSKQEKDKVLRNAGIRA